MARLTVTVQSIATADIVSMILNCRDCRRLLNGRYLTRANIWHPLSQLTTLQYQLTLSSLTSSAFITAISVISRAERTAVACF